MRILLGLTYYRPHVSGLTIYVERLARELVERGHQVTVLTSQYEKHLPKEEIIDGARVVRVPVAFRISKGVIMPTLGVHAMRLIRHHDVVSLHLPMFDAFSVAVRGRASGTPTILTYHCDLQLPPGLFNRAVDQAIHAGNSAAARLADRIVAYTEDYATHSRLLRQHRQKITVIPPPVVMPAPTPEAVDSFRNNHGLEGRTVIGIAARFSAEKGIEHLVDAIPRLLPRYPDLKVLFAGPYEHVIGEEAYRHRLKPRLDALGDHWSFVGTLRLAMLPAFYGSLDVLALTSVNSTESFGLVQVEAMLCGTPVVASNLPGVRQPVTVTGMGKVVPVADSPALAEGITAVLSDPARYRRTREEIEHAYDLDATVSSYERLFDTLMTSRVARSRRAKRAEQKQTTV
ncbi:MAG: glycosyltransferase family 4 protein [Chloroflexia bacterium]|nr:glycosyltransferase family 4 protein [Chloroflexia bacterium]